MAGSGAVAAFGGVGRRVAWGVCCATTAAAQVQQGEFSDCVLGHCVGAPVGGVGFCFGLGAGEEGGGLFLNGRGLFRLRRFERGFRATETFSRFLQPPTDSCEFNRGENLLSLTSSSAKWTRNKALH